MESSLFCENKKITSRTFPRNESHKKSHEFMGFPRTE